MSNGAPHYGPPFPLIGHVAWKGAHPRLLVLTSASVGCQERLLLSGQGPSIIEESVGKKGTHRCWVTPKAPERLETPQGWSQTQHFPSWPECRWQGAGGSLWKEKEAWCKRCTHPSLPHPASPRAVGTDSANERRAKLSGQVALPRWPDAWCHLGKLLPLNDGGAPTEPTQGQPLPSPFQHLLPSTPAQGKAGRFVGGHPGSAVCKALSFLLLPSTTPFLVPCPPTHTTPNHH